MEASEAPAGGDLGKRKTVPSMLASFLISMFAWGHCTPQLVQEVSAVAHADFTKARKEDADLEYLDKLAALGIAGIHDRKMHQDLIHR